MFYIYQIINLTNGKMYIGRTERLSARWKEHRETAQSNSAKSAKKKRPIHHAISKYGLGNFDFRIIQIVKSLAEAMASEMYWIQYYKTNLIKYGDNFGYNLSDGGEGNGSGMPMSDITKQKISKALKGIIKSKEWCLNISVSKTQFSNQELMEIKKLLIENISTYKISKMFNCSQSVISDMKLGKSHLYYFTPQDIEQFQLRMPNKKGEKNGSAKLKEFQVKEIKILLRDGVPMTKIAQKYNVGTSTIGRIKHGTHWAFVK